MILSVHAIFGAAVASAIPTHPVAGFALGFLSHLALDAIPHKDYHLISNELKTSTDLSAVNLLYKKFRLLRDLSLIFLDTIVGICLAFLLFFNPVHPFIFLIGIAGGLFPDFLTLSYIFFKHKSLGHFFDFHTVRIHYNLHLNQVLGVFLQFCTVAILVGVLFGVKALL